MALLMALIDYDGVELDIRDNASGIVIAHDAFTKDAFYLEDLLNDLDPDQRKKFFALNIKADGLGKELTRLLKFYEITNYMCFDLSSPEQIKYKEFGLHVFGRVSDKEGIGALNQYKGCVVDCFQDEIDLRLLNSDQDLFFISPELHGRSHETFWGKLLQKYHDKENVYVCTDYPEEFQRRKRS